jgi:hypothetical protein
MNHGPINFGGVGDIDMFPDETGAQMRRLFDAGKIFGDALPAANAAIDKGEQEANTGFDTLSVDFRASYKAYETELDKLSPGIQPMVENLGSSGTRIVGEYLQHADEDAARMRSLE